MVKGVNLGLWGGVEMCFFGDAVLDFPCFPRIVEM